MEGPSHARPEEGGSLTYRRVARPVGPVSRDDVGVCVSAILEDRASRGQDGLEPRTRAIAPPPPQWPTPLRPGVLCARLRCGY